MGKIAAPQEAGRNALERHVTLKDIAQPVEVGPIGWR